MSQRTDLDTVPIQSNNNLNDVISWVQLGDLVYLKNKDGWGRPFHNVASEVSTEEEIITILTNNRVIVIDVSDFPNLLDDGEWNSRINQSCDDPECVGCSCCTVCTYVKDHMDSLPHIYHLPLTEK
jgi:hypothetical protein